MPIIQVFMVEGRTKDQKKSLIRELTDGAARAIGAKPESVRVILTEMPTSNFGVAGEAKFD